MHSTTRASRYSKTSAACHRLRLLVDLSRWLQLASVKLVAVVSAIALQPWATNVWHLGKWPQAMGELMSIHRKSGFASAQLQRTIHSTHPPCRSRFAVTHIKGGFFLFTPSIFLWEGR